MIVNTPGLGTEKREQKPVNELAPSNAAFPGESKLAPLQELQSMRLVSEVTGLKMSAEIRGGCERGERKEKNNSENREACKRSSETGRENKEMSEYRM